MERPIDFSRNCGFSFSFAGRRRALTTRAFFPPLCHEHVLHPPPTCRNSVSASLFFEGGRELLFLPFPKSAKRMIAMVSLLRP